MVCSALSIQLSDVVHVLMEEQMDSFGTVWLPGWYFWDEYDRHGPFETKDAAQKACNAYGETL